MSSFQAKARREPERPKVDVWSFSPLENQRRILGFSGKLGSGKDTLTRHLYSLVFLGVLNPAIEAGVSNEGKLLVRRTSGFEVFDEDARDNETQMFLQQHIWPFMRKFSTADPLKNFLHSVLNVPIESLWGTQEQKLALLDHLRWENMPGIIPAVSKKTRESSKTGPMSGREIMEFFGSDIIRKMYPRAWAKALTNEILAYGSAHSIVNDVRFQDEVEELKSIGGKIIRLTRETDEAKANNHRSNVELDNFDGFDAVIDNAHQTQEQTFAELNDILLSWGWFSVVQHQL